MTARMCLGVGQPVTDGNESNEVLLAEMGKLM